MPRQFLRSLIASLFVLVPLSAQNPSKVKPAEMEVRFHDGTILRKAEIQQNVDVITKDGKVTVLAGDIRRIEFGLRLPKETAAKIADAIGRLHSANFAERDAASKELTALGYRAYPALQAPAKSEDREVSKRVADILSKIRESIAPELLQLKDHDVIITRDLMLVTGRIQDSTVKIRTQSMGEVSLKLADLYSLGSKKGGISVGAGLYGESIQWHDTGIVVDSDTGLVIRASGEIVHPLGFGLQLVTGPEGGFGRQLLTAPEGRFGANWECPYHRPGTLVGKIGDKTDYFAVGKHFEGKTAMKGRLFLWVVPSLGSENKPTGAYRVEVVVGAKLGEEAKKLVLFNNDIEAAIMPFRDKRTKLMHQAIAWRSALRSGTVASKDRAQYEQAIYLNLEEIERLDQVIRKDFGHVLYPARWLEPPSDVAIWRMLR